MTPEITYRIGIIGCGKMGKDLFEFLMGFTFHITIVCHSEATVAQIKKTFEKKQNRALKYQLIDQEVFDFHHQNTEITTDLHQLSSCNLVIESITEDLHLKRKLFKKLENIISRECIIASNTSSIAPDLLFEELSIRDRCMGLHFFFPAGMKDFVEVNVSKNTSENTIQQVKEFLGDIGKIHLVLYENNHFFINRIFLKMQAGCCLILSEGEYKVQEIDDAVKETIFPLGIFDFFDHVGIDVMLQSVQNYIQYKDDSSFYQPMLDVFESKEKQGKLGIKTGSGFYEYVGNRAIREKSPEKEMTGVQQKIIHWYLDGVFDANKKAICTKDVLSHIVTSYMLVEKNPFDLAKEVGYAPK